MLGGLAAENRLDFYEGSTSLQGFSQALQIVTHAWLNHAIITKATALKRAKFEMRPYNKGSFLVSIVAIIESYPATSALLAIPLYDFLKYTLSRASGIPDIFPVQGKAQSIWEKEEPFFDDLAETVEGALQRAHHPIGETVDRIILERPRAPLVEFDEGTKDWVNTRDIGDNVQQLNGNVTRYNSVTGNGRMYVQELGKIVPFRPDDSFSPIKVSYLTWSLHGSANSLPKKLSLSAKKVETASGHTKRLLVQDCETAEEDAV